VDRLSEPTDVYKFRSTGATVYPRETDPWGTNQPDGNRLTYVGTKEDCVVLNENERTNENNKWHDYPCYSRMWSICELEGRSKIV
jgi:hypothetical protein